MALAASRALVALQQAVALEALAATASLRMLEGPPVPVVAASDLETSDASAASSSSPAAAAGASTAAGVAGDDKKKDKKKEKKGGAAVGVVLGKGTALLRAFVERAACESLGEFNAKGTLRMRSQPAPSRFATRLCIPS